MIDELSALKSIQEQFNNASNNLVLGIGDDAAAVRFDADMLVLSTTDSQVEDVHFIKSLVSASELARKAVAVSVSDVGAMGGIPRFILASVGFSEREDEKFLEDLISGFKDSEQEFEVKLIGGNLSSSSKIFIDITVLGEVEPELMIKRSGANVGDLIYATGTLGDSALGLKIIQDGERDRNNYLVKKHIGPQPRLKVARELAQSKIPTSMIDISDGLLLDLERISVDQGIGAKLEVHNIPTSKEYDELAQHFSQNLYELALSGGEDYELLFTANEKYVDEVKRISDRMNVRITEIGSITDANSIDLLSATEETATLEKRGFVHFNN